MHWRRLAKSSLSWRTRSRTRAARVDVFFVRWSLWIAKARGCAERKRIGTRRRRVFCRGGESGCSRDRSLRHPQYQRRRQSRPYEDSRDLDSPLDAVRKFR